MSVGVFGTASARKNITISAVKFMNIATKWDTNKVISSLKSAQVMFCCQVGYEQNLGFSGLWTLESCMKGCAPCVMGTIFSVFTLCQTRSCIAFFSAHSGRRGGYSILSPSLSFLICCLKLWNPLSHSKAAERP